MKAVPRHPSVGRVLLGLGVLGWLSMVGVMGADPAVCVPGWEWSYNSKGQNPCEIAGSLQAPCLGYATYTLGPLAVGSYYLPPASNDTAAKDCGCNTVIYSLYQACSECQFTGNQTNTTWGSWAQYCGQVYVAEYPFAIPFNASVPHWAYLNDTNPGFDPVLAQSAGRDPEATPTNPPTASIPSSTSSSKNTVSTNPGTDTSPSPSSTGDVVGGSKKNTGAIVGGVVGGVVGVTLLGAIAFFFIRKQTSTSGNPNDYAGVNQMPYSPGAAEPQFYEAPKVYNPMDPSTYPAPVSGADSGNTGRYTTNPPQVGMYHGAAEI